MGLIGREIKEIKEALKSAFPRREKLLEMLRIQLDIYESEVPNDSDYDIVLFQLIIKLEREDRIIKLIQRASEYLPLNTDLQDLSKNFSAKLLSQILAPLETDYIKQMKQAYFACFTENWHEDCERPIPDTLKQILDNLVDMPQGNAPYSCTVQFVARLLVDAEILQPTAKKLKAWGEEQENNFPELLTQINNEKVSRKEQKSVPTYLIVLLQPSKQHQNKRYFVSAWFIPDGRNNKFDFRTGQGYKFLDFKNQEKDTFTLREISIVLEDLLKQINSKYTTDHSEPPIIVFFLPLKLLNKPLDSCKIGNFPLGILYQVVIRSCGRLKDDYGFRSVWIQKWQNLQQQVNHSDSNNVILGNCDSRTLFVQLNKSNTIGLKLTQPPSKEIINVIEQTATPVAIWVRSSLKEINCQAELDALLRGAIAGLPSLVKQKRVEAFPIEDKEKHIGHHLSLLWEDPCLLPPRITYATP